MIYEDGEEEIPPVDTRSFFTDTEGMRKNLERLREIADKTPHLISDVRDTVQAVKETVKPLGETIFQARGLVKDLSHLFKQFGDLKNDKQKRSGDSGDGRSEDEEGVRRDADPGEPS